jgi:hypothetical protein
LYKDAYEKSVIDVKGESWEIWQILLMMSSTGLLV